MKSFVKSVFEQVGLDVRRIPRSASKPAKGGLSFHRTALGDVYLPTDAPLDSIAYHMRRGTVFEPEVVATARRFIKPGSTVLDVGSNFGQMAMLFAKDVGPTGKVYAFEAQRRVHEILCKNIAANKLENIEAVYRAVYSESDRIFHFPEPDFERFAAFGSYNLPLDGKNGPEVVSLKIDDVEFSGPISFMKVDVQGCDLFAMQGATNTIKRFGMPILFEFEQRFQDEYKTDFQDYVEFVHSIGYRFAETVLDINFLIIPNAK